MVGTLSSVARYSTNFTRAEDLVADVLTRLARQGRVLSYPYDGFWMPADTVKERVVLDQLAMQGQAPWELWRRDLDRSAGARGTPTAPLGDPPRRELLICVPSTWVRAPVEFSRSALTATTLRSPQAERSYPGLALTPTASSRSS